MADTKPKTGRLVASYLFPVVGAVTYLQLKNSEPEKAKSYGYASLIGLGVYAFGLIYRKMSATSTVGAISHTKQYVPVYKPETAYEMLFL